MRSRIQPCFPRPVKSHVYMYSPVRTGMPATFRSLLPHGFTISFFFSGTVKTRSTTSHSKNTWLSNFAHGTGCRQRESPWTQSIQINPFGSRRVLLTKLSSMGPILRLYNPDAAATPDKPHQSFGNSQSLPNTELRTDLCTYAQANRLIARQFETNCQVTRNILLS